MKDPKKMRTIKMTICSICLEKILTPRIAFVFNLVTTTRLNHIKCLKPRVLRCGHVFHEGCVSKIYKPVCPLCCHPIFTHDEESLLKLAEQAQPDETKIKDILTSDGVDVLLIFQFLSRRHLGPVSFPGSQTILDVMYKFCDFTQILADNLDNPDVVERVIDCNINWFQTFGGKTFFELVFDKTTNQDIVNLILDKMPPSPTPTPSPQTSSSLHLHAALPIILPPVECASLMFPRQDDEHPDEYMRQPPSAPPLYPDLEDMVW